MYGTVSPLTNRFLSVTGIPTPGFGRTRYGRLFLAIAGLFVRIVSYVDLNLCFSV